MLKESSDFVQQTPLLETELNTNKMANENSERDFAGDQIGWSVRQIIPPAPELKRLDKKIMSLLPLPIRRWVALQRFYRGWLPKPNVDPLTLYKKHVVLMGTQYFDQFSQRNGIKTNTMLILVNDEPVRVHNFEFKEGDREVLCLWKNKLGWAETIEQRRIAGKTISTTDL